MKVFVQLAYGFGASSWRQKWQQKTLLGINEEQAYGYHRAASENVSITYSEDEHEGPFGKALRYVVRGVLGFDFIHAWRNRAGILTADVVWTHTESQTLAVLLLLRILHPLRPPEIIGQTVWLVDRWEQQPLLRRILFRFLLKRLSLLTVLSVSNLQTARRLFPWLDVRQVRFGIRADEMQAPRLTCRQKTLTLLALGNDEHRDWETLCAAVRLLPDVKLLVASKSRAARQAVKNTPDAQLVKARDNEALMRLYDTADIVIVPLRPNQHVSGVTVIQEAVLRGVPVIASDCGGLSDYFDSRCLTYVPSGSPEALAAAVQHIRTDPDAALHRTECAQERMRKVINSENYAQEHVTLSRKLLEGEQPLPDLPQHPKVLVGIATTGRAAILKDLLKDLARQTVKPASVVVCYQKDADIEGIPENGTMSGVPLLLVKGKGGSAEQRNIVLDHAGDADIVLFADDDFFPHTQYIQAITDVFLSDSRILGLTGHLLADGAKTPGYSPEFAQKMLEHAVPDPKAPVTDIFNTYGCNMAFRLDAIRRYGVRFDENLPLYAWYEDMDFSRQLLPYGRLVKAGAALGVHLGSKRGKTSGLRFGYSQIANPIYLARKGTYPWDHALRSAGRHTLINIIRTLRPESWIDRKGRMQGNWKAWGDLVRGRLDPRRICEF